MTSAAKKILDEALALPERDREALVEALSDSLERPRYELSDEWKAEIARRIEAVERGESKLIEGDEVDVRLREALQRVG